ncbi:MAG: hypothetical protein ACFCVH_15275 [Alphaproteobacteria bacterium]
MPLASRSLALVFATILATADPALATDPAGSAPSARLPADLPMQSLPLPGRIPTERIPTGHDLRLLSPPELPGDLSARDDAAVDATIGVLDAVLLGAPGSCNGLIPCCNTAQDAGCEFVSYDIACVEAGGFIQIDILPDGSTQFSCPVP